MSGDREVQLQHAHRDRVERIALLSGACRAAQGCLRHCHDRSPHDHATLAITFFSRHTGSECAAHIRRGRPSATWKTSGSWPRAALRPAVCPKRVDDLFTGACSLYVVTSPSHQRPGSGGAPKPKRARPPTLGPGASRSGLAGGTRHRLARGVQGGLRASSAARMRAP